MNGWGRYRKAEPELAGTGEGLASDVLTRLESREALQAAPERGLDVGKAITWITWGLTGLAIGIGVALRAWYIFHQPISSDEAVVGLMVDQILHGHFSSFYWGQVYGGAEPYLVVPLFAIFGSSVWALKVAPVILAAAAAVVAWRIARHLVSDSAVAALAGAVIWAAPQSAVLNSTMEMGFRGVTLLCGLSVVLLALRIWEGEHSWWIFVGLGLIAGVGWWSSPEIVYYVVPATWLVLASIGRGHEVQRLHRWGLRLLVALIAAVLGALPWLWANINSGFQSLNTNSFSVPPNEPSYVSRLHLFFQYMLPMLASLRAEMSGVWLFAKPLAVLVTVLLVLAGAIALVLGLLRDATSRALAVGVILFPLLLALSPATWFWGDGRYANLGFPLIVLVLLFGSAEVSRPVSDRGARSRRQALARWFLVAAIMAVFLAFSVANFATFIAPGSSFFTSWRNPDGPSLTTASELEARHIRYAYADYWVAYKLDFVSDNRLKITTAGGDVDRWWSQHLAVRRSSSAAWLFTTPTGEAVVQFGATASIQGPNGMSETQFLTALRRLGVGYHVVQAGLLQAVIPDGRVTYAEVAQASRHD